MNILSLTYFLNGFLMIVMPIGLTIIITRKFKTEWRLFWIGAATFVVSQIIHIPFNAIVTPVFNQQGFITLPKIVQNMILSVFLGLSAGIFEEFSRYGMYRWWAKDARSWGSGLLAGAGHGGIEAIILGILVLYGYIQMSVARGMDVTTLVTADRVDLAKAQIQAYWSAPWAMTLLGAVERMFTIPLHLACSILVLQAFTRKKFWWVILAIIFHALADGTAVYTSQIGLSTVAIEGVIGVFAIISLVIIFVLRQPEPIAESNPPLPLTPKFQSAPVIETKETIDDTRFQ